MQLNGLKYETVGEFVQQPYIYIYKIRMLNKFFHNIYIFFCNIYFFNTIDSESQRIVNVLLFSCAEHWKTS